MTNNNNSGAIAPVPLARPAESQDAYIKALVWGDPGAGKSRFALSFPGPLVADLEKSTAHYAREFGHWLAEPSQSHPPHVLVRDLVTEIINGVYPHRRTLIIDPITDYLDHLEAAIIASLEKTGLNLDNLKGPKRAQAYAKINDRMRKELDRMLMLPMHIVWIARAKNEWAETDKGLAPVGRRYDAKEIVESLSDIVIHLQKDGRGIIKKARLAALPEEIRSASYADLRSALDFTEPKVDPQTNIAMEAAMADAVPVEED